MQRQDVPDETDVPSVAAALMVKSCFAFLQGNGSHCEPAALGIQEGSAILPRSKLTSGLLAPNPGISSCCILAGAIMICL